MIPKFSHKSVVMSSGAFIGFYNEDVSGGFWYNRNGESRPYRKQVYHNELGPALLSPDGSKPEYYLKGELVSLLNWSMAVQPLHPEITDEYIVWLILNHA
jgi:hypothetical protein